MSLHCELGDLNFFQRNVVTRGNVKLTVMFIYIVSSLGASFEHRPQKGLQKSYQLS